MDIPFPALFPRMVDSKWFNADNPCDEDTELLVLEEASHHWLTTVGQQFTKRAPLGKSDQEQMEEEADSDEEEGNDESDESEESHDEDEELRTSYSSARNNNDLEQDSLDDMRDPPDNNSSDQSALWPLPM
ncbi:unnamed protein product [Colias eurytheme]|nr:unnamed protein product [Colias eurytheme]